MKYEYENLFFILKILDYVGKKQFILKGERDMILMRHEVTIRWPDGRRELKVK